MALLDRLKRAPSSTTPPTTPDDPKVVSTPPAAAEEAEPEHDARYQELKSRVHNRLFDVIDFARIATVSDERIREDIALATVQIVEEEKFLLTLKERETFIREIQDEVFGLGPLEPLLQDPTVADILVNGHRNIYVERHGKIEPTVASFRDDAHLMRIIEKIVSAVGRRVDESSPLVDARLADGSRVNVIVPPLALDGPTMSIRRFGSDPLGIENLIEVGAVTEKVAEVLEGIVKCRLNILISGGTGAGKTTLLNAISGFIPEDERIVTIEDSAELQLKQRHVVRLETRPANIEGKGKITQRDLVINSLRMRPDRIVVGEVRSSEALDMLQAMNTGHDGSLTTIHANTPRDALTRIETMVAMAGVDVPQRAVRNQISAAIHIVIQLSRLSDGRRKLVSLQEITGMEGEIVTMQEIFEFRREGIDEDGKVIGELLPTGIRPQFSAQLETAGYKLSDGIFEP
jgi:pilus assembly protein CpaF